MQLRLMKRSVDTAFYGGFLIICSLLCLVEPVASAPAAAIEVVNAPDNLWKLKVRRDIERVNGFLCDTFPLLPTRVRVVRDCRLPEYDLQRSLIFLDESYIPVELYHEYGHRVLDTLLRARSSVVGYYYLRNRLRHRSLVRAVAELELELTEDLRYLGELRRQSRWQLAQNLSRSVRRSRSLIFESSASLHLEPELSRLYPQYLGLTRQRSLHQLLGPYHELFADSLAVLMTRRWFSVHMGRNGFSPVISESGGRLQGCSFPVASMPQGQIYARSFRSDITADSYRFSYRDSDSYYSQFAPVRAHIRQLSESHFRQRPALLLRYLADAIVGEVEDRLRHPALYSLSLADQNRRLSARLVRHAAAMEKPGPVELHAELTEHHCGSSK